MTTQIYNEKIKKIYGADPRELPLYGIADTAHYLKLHVNTLRSWLYGRNYIVGDEIVKSLPIINMPDPKRPLLSFINLVEVYVLSSLTRIHNVRFQKVRAALGYLEKNFDEPNPLANKNFWTDKFEVFVEFGGGDLICVSRAGQMVMKEVVEQYLHRVDRDVDLTPFRLHPFSKQITFGTDKVSDKNSPKLILENTPKNIAIEPLIAFGRPTIAGTGIATNVIVGRFKAGEDVTDLAKDYDITEGQVQEALEYEGVARKAA